MTTTDLEVSVLGTPIPQGSKSGFKRKGTERIIVIDNNAKKLKPWREAISAATHNAIAAQDYRPADGPLQAELTFYFDRPAYHFGTGKNAGRLKADAPWYVDVKPDIDKLVRAVLDGLTDAAAWADDARCARLAVEQLYVAPGQAAGVLARIRPIQVRQTPPPALEQPEEVPEELALFD